MHNPATAAGSLGLLVAVVWASFAYVSANPAEIPREPWLGITGSFITPEIAEELGLEQQQGFLISAVEPASPADTAGLQVGDVIVAIDNREIAVEQDITAVMDEKEIGDNINFSIRREGATQNISVTLGERPSR
ncbi:MAG: PDZ domain-containing protein [Nitrososphaera sp.]|nr:PDZ domain-containing protein [Nitrososphaera sp.]